MKSQLARILPAIILRPFITGINALAVDGIQQPCGSTYKRIPCSDEEPPEVCGVGRTFTIQARVRLEAEKSVLIKRQRGDKIHVADGCATCFLPG